MAIKTCVEARILFCLICVFSTKRSMYTYFKIIYARTSIFLFIVCVAIFIFIIRIINSLVSLFLCDVGTNRFTVLLDFANRVNLFQELK